MRITNIGRYAAATLLVAGLGASPAAAASARPDLSVSTLSGSVGSLAPGASVTATLKVRNAGPGRARASTLALYLARGAKHARADVRLATAKVPALKRRGTARRALRTTLPAFTPAATYRLLACADSAGKVRERSERNNCRAAKGAVVVRRSAAPGATNPVAVSAPAPLAPPAAPPTAGERDADADGFPAGPDCNDADAAIHPGATDAPDLTFTDSNCDGIDGDAARAVFVAPVGDDAASGTRDDPKRTLGAALATATNAGRDLYVSRGIYPELLIIRGGVSVYGGYDLDWTRSDANETRVAGSSPSHAAVLALGVQTPTTLQLLSIAPDSPATDDTSVYGLKADHSPSLVLDHLAISVPDGRAGRPGAPGARGADGRAGAAGGKGSCDGPYPGGGGGATGPRVGRAGGEGGDGQSSYGDNPHTNGQDGAGVEGGAGGARGSSGDPGTAGAAGGNGGAGTFRSDGAGAGPGQLSGSDWLSPAGGAGLSGTDGSGGGGGGGGGRQHCTLCDDGSGNGGGEGGEGGAGGRGGQGGEGGGGSFGVFLSSSPGVVIKDSVIRAGQGGAGGQGGLGGFGGSGGARGEGSGACTSEVGAGGNGGVGGGGGRGGNGGGGAGGPSIAIFRGGYPITMSGTTLSHASGGPGGTGPGGGGAAGDAADVR